MANLYTQDTAIAQHLNDACDRASERASFVFGRVSFTVLRFGKSPTTMIIAAKMLIC